MSGIGPVRVKWIYFPLKVQITKIIANNLLQSCGRWTHLGRNITYECLLGQPVSVLSRKNTSFKKDTEKVVLLLVKDLIQIIVKFRAKKLLCMFLSCTKYPIEGHKILCMKTVSYAHLKMERLISGTQFGSWFLKKASRSACFFTLVFACKQKIFAPKFPTFSALSLNYLLWTSGYWHEDLYT